jgi:hypothetical protein
MCIAANSDLAALDVQQGTDRRHATRMRKSCSGTRHVRYHHAGLAQLNRLIFSPFNPSCRLQQLAAPIFQIIDLVKSRIEVSFAVRP